MRFKITLLLATALVVPAVASAQKVHTDYDRAVNFAQYKTYFWAKTDAGANDIANQRILTAVDEWLAKAGWTKAAEGEAQLALMANVSTKERQTINTMYDSYGGGWGYGGWAGYRMGGMGSSTTTVNTFTEGTLVVDIFDAKTKKLVWRGIATDTISSDPSKNIKKIQNSAKKMFEKKFPPGAAQS
jgi:Domain of unknown function (DUF4136)